MPSLRTKNNSYYEQGNQLRWIEGLNMKHDEAAITKSLRKFSHSFNFEFRVVMERTADGFYKIGTKQGLISSLKVRNQIQNCKWELKTSQERTITSIDKWSQFCIWRAEFSKVLLYQELHHYFLQMQEGKITMQLKMSPFNILYQ